MLGIFCELGRLSSRSVPYEPVKEGTYLFVLDVCNRRIYTEEMDSLKGQRYVWVGNRKGNQPKDRLIVGGKDALRYLIFSTVPLLMDELKRLNMASTKSLLSRLEDLKKSLGVLELKDGNGNTFEMLGVYELLDTDKRQTFLKELKNRVSKDTNASAFQLPTLEGTLKSWASLYQRHDGFEKAVSQAFYRAVTEDIPSKSMILWTFKDKQGILTEDSGYLDHVIYTFRPQLDEAKEGVCRICNRKGKITPQTTAFRFFKFCNTDKPGFAPLLDKDLFSSTFGLCPSCYALVLEGDRFLWDKLRTKLANINVVLVPHPTPEKADLSELSELIKRRLNATDTVEAWKEFQDTLKEQAEVKALWEGIKDNIYFDLIFFKASNSAVKVFKVIHEVPPSRLNELDDARIEALEWANQHFLETRGKKSPWDLDLRTQFSLIPTRKDTDFPSLFLNYLEALLYGEAFPRQVLVKGFLEIARAHHLGYTGAFKGLQNKSVEQFMVQTLTLQYYGEKLGVLHPFDTGGSLMVSECLSEHLKSYLENHIPKGRPRGLFLIGYVIGLIARAQQKGMSKEGQKSPSILNAISFNGMDDVKVRRLVNYVADRMRHYLKGWDYDEGETVLAVAIQFFEEAKDPLPNYENTYWVLAGYGFSRLGLRKRE